MYKKVLIPLDGSELAEAVFPCVKELAGKLELHMVFLYICNPHESESIVVYRAYVEHVAEIIKRQSKEIQKRAGSQTQGQRIKASGKVIIGHPAEEILRFAYEKEVDLIVMATHGRSGIKRWALGSIADKVLRSSAVPVWLVRVDVPETITRGEWPMRTILVPLDGSELAESILPHVETLAKQGDTELVDVVLLMVCEPLVIPPISTIEMEVPVSLGNLVEEHIVHAKKVADQYLAGVATRLNDAGIKVSSEVIEGTPAEEIINCANRYPSSLIAMATHGRSGIGRWTYGSVAEKVLSGASTPVLLVRPPSNDGLSLLDTFIGTVRALPPL